MNWLKKSKLLRKSFNTSKNLYCWSKWCFSKKICQITYSKVQGRPNLISYYANKIIFYNKTLRELNDKTEYIIPMEYKNYFLELYPNQKVDDKDNYFITNIPVQVKF